MTKSEKISEKKSISMLVELPHDLRLIVLKRGRLLREGGDKGLSLLVKGGPKSWLAAAMKTNSKTQVCPWEKAHEIATKIRGEFGQAVYVEPEACLSGASNRFQEMNSSDNFAGVDGPDDEFDRHNSFDNHFVSSPVSSYMPGPAGSNTPGMMGVSMGGRGGAINPFTGNMFQGGSPMDSSSRHTSNIPGMPSREISQTSSRKSLKFPSLFVAPGWSELSETTRLMFEVEAAQIMNNGFQSPVGLEIVDDYSALIVLTLQPNISKQLRKFLEPAIACTPETEGNLV